MTAKGPDPSASLRMTLLAKEARGIIAEASSSAFDRLSFILRKLRTYRLFWLVPVLAVAAYAPVLSMWFVGDDFGHLLTNEQLPWPQPFLTFAGGEMFYRPLSTTLTWNLGHALFGTNALPYHAISLALHALAAWLLARAVAAISGEIRTGWLAGALFAVYPLSTEPVAWLAAQWDLWAAVCALAAVWGFAHAWRTAENRTTPTGHPQDANRPEGTRKNAKDRWGSLVSGMRSSVARPYLLGFLAMLLGVLMKESVLPLPLVLPFVALATSASARHSDDTLWTSDPSAGSGQAFGLWTTARRAVLWTLPYALPSALFVGLRVGAGGIGGYIGDATDPRHVFWDSIVAAGVQMAMPLNRSVFHVVLVQLLGLIVTVSILVALVLWGRRRWPLLLLSLVWSIAFVLPAAGLVKVQPDNLNNRLLYLSLAGFCIGLAALLSGLLEEMSAKHGAYTQRVRGTRTAKRPAPRSEKLMRRIGPVVPIALILIAVPVTWVQLQPWVQSSKQTQHILREMGKLLEPVRGQRVLINATDLPGAYKGSFVFWNGFEDALLIFNDQPAKVQEVPHLDPAELAQPLANIAGIYNLDFSFNPADQMYYVDSLAGVTGPTPPPAEEGEIWDYTVCGHTGHNGLVEWEAHRASFRCTESPREPLSRGTNYRVYRSGGADAVLLSSPRVDLAGARWVRLALAARLPRPEGTREEGRSGRWEWVTGGQADRIEGNREFGLDATGAWRTYSVYVPAAEVGEQLDILRLAPVTARLQVDIAWIAVIPVR
jgi:hypothetical protein